LQEEATSLFSELQRQARSAPRFESQVQLASQRCDELEATITELQEQLVRMGCSATTGSAHVTSLAALAGTGGFGSPPGGRSQQHLAYGGAGELPASPSDASLYSHSHGAAALAAGAGGGYGDESCLAAAAMEQQLTLAERRWDDEHAAVER
jgi:hypothetical protein